MTCTPFKRPTKKLGMQGLFILGLGVNLISMDLAKKQNFTCHFIEIVSFKTIEIDIKREKRECSLGSSWQKKVSVKIS